MTPRPTSHPSARSLALRSMVCAAVGAGLLAMAGCGGDRAPVPPVVLVTIDTLPADRVGCYGCPLVRTPFLDRLARSGLQVIDAVSPAPITLPSHATILTGVDPPVHGVRDNGMFLLPDEAVSLPERLPAATPKAAFVGSFPLQERFGLAQGFDVYDDDFGASRDRRGPPERTADAVFDRASAWLADAGEGAFLWTHVFDPHAPYRPPRPYAEAARALHGAGDYEGEVAFADREFGRFLRRIGEAASDRGATVIVAADHGESLGAHDELTHSIFVYDATQRVPLLAAGPGFAPRLEAQPRRLVDVAPTILETFGVEVPADLPGWSLRDESGDDEAYVESKYPELMRGWSPLHGVRTSDWKYIRAPRPELYDLHRDPGELHDVTEAHPDVAADLSARLDAILADAAERATGNASAGGMDAETAERLRSLGYVATIDPGSAVDARVDPKDGIHVVVAISNGQIAYEAREFDKALKLFRRAVELDPDAKEAYSFLAGTCYELGRYEESVSHAERSLQLPPHVNEGPVRATLGQALLQLGRPADALPQLNAALSQRPNDERLRQLVAEAKSRL